MSICCNFIEHSWTLVLDHREMGGKQKSKHGKKGRDSEGPSGRNRWLKNELAGDFESLSLAYDIPPPSTKKHSAPKSRRNRTVASISKNERLTVDVLEQSDRKKLARARAAGHVPIAETVDRHRCYVSSRSKEHILPERNLDLVTF